MKKEKEEEGFSLVELVVVVAVLAVLAAIAVPSFTCVRRRASATAALAAMKQIQKECLINKITDADLIVFTPSILQDYQIQSIGENSCGGDEGSGLISAIPNNTAIYPTFILSTNTDELSCSFKGQIGTDFSNCLGLICNTNEGDLVRKRIESEEYDDFVIENAYIQRGCSAYVIIEADTWESAEDKSIALGGNLITINDQSEYSWLQENIWKENSLLKSSNYKKKNINSLSMYFVGLNDTQEEGKYEWSSGQTSDWNNNEDLISRQNWLAQQHMATTHDYFVVHSNDYGFTDYENTAYRPDLYTGKGVGALTWVDNSSSFYKGWDSPHFGIAEIPLCKN